MVCRWERGISMPTGEQLLKLSILYRVLPTELYFEAVKEYEKELVDISEGKGRST